MSLLNHMMLLLEGKAEWIIENNPKIVDAVYDRLLNDQSFLRDYNPEKYDKIVDADGNVDEQAKKIAIFKDVANKISEHKLIKKYLIWFLREYVRGEYMIEDDLRVDMFLKNFEAAKNKDLIDEKDIMKYTYDSLVNKISEFSEDELKSDNQKKKELREPKKDLNINGVDVVVNTPNIIIYKPDTFEGEKLICPARDSKGRVNRWCTYANASYFDMYTNDRYKGPLFPFHDLNTDEWYQLHFESDQLKDIDDREVSNREKFIKQRPDLYKFVVDYLEKNPTIIKEAHGWKPFINDINISDDLKEYLKFFGSDLGFLKEKYDNKSVINDKKLLSSIIKKNPRNIIYVYKAPEELQWEAVKLDPSAFKKNCSPEIRKYVLEKDGSNLARFTSYKVRTADGDIKTVKPNEYLTDEDIKLGIKNNPLVLLMLDNSLQTAENQIYALQCDFENDEKTGKINHELLAYMGKDMLPKTKEWLKKNYPEEYKKYKEINKKILTKKEK